jgi:agmatine/peptidylarginine deiminase
MCDIADSFFSGQVPSPVVLVRPEEENHNVDVESRIFVAGYRLPATYANLFIANEAVFVPTFDVCPHARTGSASGLGSR